ncbi:Cloroperoxidase [Trametopsis cervina]|nr:Cloroperoxidase [Trametopsis cervina]
MIQATTRTTAASEDHAYRYGTKTDSRCPCPALNAMANHGYLPRNGRDITVGQMTASLQEVYNLSWPLAAFLTVVGMLLCGRWWSLPWRFDLHDLARHNAVEHNCSLTHPDAAPGELFAPNHVSYTLLCRLLDAAKQDHLCLTDFVDARIRRAQEDTKPLDAMHREIAHGEAALTLLVLGERPSENSPGSSIVVRRRFVKEWFGKDKLPKGWKKPSREIGLRDAAGLSAIIKQRIHVKLNSYALSA